jgi:hypothetical protein
MSSFSKFRVWSISNPTCIDNFKRGISFFTHCCKSITGDPRLVMNDRKTSSNKTIKERGFTKTISTSTPLSCSTPTYITHKTNKISISIIFRSGAGYMK